MFSLYLTVGIFGALIGSFLNVCIYRLPRHESIAWPGSHCPFCSCPIAWYDNIPLVSYLILLSRCRHCAVRISFRYPLVEAINAIGYIGLLWFFGPSWPAVAYGVLYSALLVVAGTDDAEILRRAPQVDLVFGPQTYHRLPELVAEALHAAAGRATSGRRLR